MIKELALLFSELSAHRIAEAALEREVQLLNFTLAGDAYRKTLEFHFREIEINRLLIVGEVYKLISRKISKWQ